MIVVRNTGYVGSARGTANITPERPQSPKPWQVWTDPNTGDQEQWNGSEWIRLTRLDQIFSRFGLGTDGNVTITGGTTTINRDMFYDNLTITATGILKTAGYRVFAKGKIINNGNIDFTGNDGASGSIGGAGASGTGGYLGAAAGGGAGGLGSPASANPGVAGTNSTESLEDADAGAAGGAGGDGTALSGGAGAVGGTVTAAAASTGSIKDPEQAIEFRSRITAPVAFGKGGGGGGGGAGGGSAAPSSSNPPGGNGGGGGAAANASLIMGAILSGTGTVTGLGGDGGDGGNGSPGNNNQDTGGGGGGGGAQAGFLLLIYSRKENYSWTITLTGGIGGLGGAPNAAGGAGTDGGDGTDGVLYEYSFS